MMQVRRDPISTFYDYYGLYLAIEQMDGQFLDQNGMPDGNLYKIEGHSAPQTIRDQPKSQTDLMSPTSKGYQNQNYGADWWRENLDIDKYLSYESSSRYPPLRHRLR